MVRRSATDVIGSSGKSVYGVMHELQVELTLDNTSSEGNKEHCQVGSVRACGLP